jgi:glyoxylase-like metal-dependent hydrolase (beta-lactamase superfamily II)
MGKIHEIQGHIESMYLIEYPSGLLLLDGGCRCDVDVVCSYVRSLGRQPNDIRVVVVTHMHPDHAGGAEIYRQRFGAQLVTGRGVEEWYAGLEGSVQHLIDIVLAYWVASRMKKPLRWLWYPKRIRFDFPTGRYSVHPVTPERIFLFCIKSRAVPISPMWC